MCGQGVKDAVKMQHEDVVTRQHVPDERHFL